MSTRTAKKKEAKGTRAAAEAAVSTIRITFEGMMMLFVKNEAAYCYVGILKYAPNHAANILITKIAGVGAPETVLHLHDADLESRMWLDVQRSTGTRISLFTTGPFVRERDIGDPSDFRWALDFEGTEMYRGRVGVALAGFKSILKINDGTFYTQQKSANKLALKRGSGDPEPPLGKVAVRLRADIPLALSDKAFFSNGATGAEVQFMPEANINYGIYISQVRHRHSPELPAIDEEIDAENYNTAVAGNVAPSRKIHFARVDRATPDAVCLTPTMSLTELSII